MTQRAFQFSVTELAEFSCRQGDLSVWGEAGPTAQEGIRGHQRLQKKRQKESDNYQVEVAVEYCGFWNDRPIVIRGRIDGLLDCNDPDNPKSDLETLIEEIKTVYVEPTLIPEASRSVQSAQLTLYAWIYAVLNQRDKIKTQLTWLHLSDDSETSETNVLTLEQLETFALKAIDRYCRWLETVEQHRGLLYQACRELEFPFHSFRPGQRALCAEVFRSVREKRHLAFEAPTGIGKSVSTLFPAIKSMGAGYVQQVVFLTAKTSGRKAAKDTCHKLSLSQAPLKTLIINAKEKTCFCTASQESDLVCPYKIGFYDRLNEAIEDCFQLNCVDETEIKIVAERHKVCPFSLSLQLIPWFDVIVCDYNYLLDPLVQLAHFYRYGDRITFLIDEAHNLIERSRNMYSAELDEQRLLEVAKQFSKLNRPLNKISEILIKLEQTERKQGSQALTIEPDKLAPLGGWISQCVSLLVDRASEKGLSSDESRLLKQVIRFSVILGLAGDNHKGFLREEPSGLIDTYALELVALNASDYLEKLYRQLRSVIFFSGTLRPAPFVRQSLGMNNEIPLKVASSVFSEEQSCVLISNVIDTRYQNREQHIDAIAEAIHCVYQSKPANYLASFGSYAFMEQVLSAYQLRYGDKHVRVQERHLSELQKQHFIHEFFQRQGILGFVIAGGYFTEGIDFPGDTLQGVIIAGTGLPQVSELQQAIKQNYEDAGLNGFDLAYRYPGLQRVLQTAGRVIRSETDRGVIVLLDKRFHQAIYRQYFPDIWQPKAFSNTEQLATSLQKFWGSTETSD